VKDTGAIRGVLLDVDGTLLAGDEAVPGAADALARLRARGIPLRLLTNTTRRSRRDVALVLRRAGLEVEEAEVLAPSVLACREIRASGRHRASLLVPSGARTDFSGVIEDDERPDWVVVGDLGSGFTWERMNRAFHALLRGAGLLALQKNRYWHAGPEAGIRIDAGPFVAALEYAAGVTARVVGKPSPDFFRLALEDLGLEAGAVLVVGDDLENDVGGGAAAGCRTALVRTGKFSQEALGRAAVPPDLLLDSVADLAS
jgi:HAD superfamily hydrolase (TIGR01458 family)